MVTFRSDKNPYDPYGFSVNPFSLKVPIQNPYKIINQEKSIAKIEDFKNSIIKGTENNLLFIVAEEGGGKSHILNYYRNMINKDEINKNVAIKIECRSRRDIIGLYPQISNEINRLAKNLKNPDLESSLLEIFAEAGTPGSISELMRIIRDITVRFSRFGYSALYIFLDEFENSLPPESITRPGRRLPYERELNRITPEAIIQLDSITQLGFVGFIVTMRESGWKRWNVQFKDKISKYEKDLIICLNNLSIEDTKKLIDLRLEAPCYRRIEPTIEPPKFNDDLIKEIHIKSTGNPRNILKISEHLFARAISIGLKEITKEHIST